MNTYKICKSIRKEIAKAMVEESEPDFLNTGRHYAVDTDGDGVLDAVMFREEMAPWNPWHDNAMAVRVSDLYADSDCTFDPTPDMDLYDEDGCNEDEFAEIAYEAAVELAESELPESVEIE